MDSILITLKNTHVFELKIYQDKWNSDTSKQENMTKSKVFSKYIQYIQRSKRIFKVFI